MLESVFMWIICDVVGLAKSFRISFAADYPGKALKVRPLSVFAGFMTTPS